MKDPVKAAEKRVLAAALQAGKLEIENDRTSAVTFSALDAAADQQRRAANSYARAVERARRSK